MISITSVSCLPSLALPELKGACYGITEQKRVKDTWSTTK